MGPQGHRLTAQAQRQEKRNTMGNFSSNPFTTKYRHDTQDTSLLSKTLLFHQKASRLLHLFSVTRVLSEYNSKMKLKASQILHVAHTKGFIAGTSGRTEDENKEQSQAKFKSLFLKVFDFSMNISLPNNVLCLINT